MTVTPIQEADRDGHREVTGWRLVAVLVAAAAVWALTETGTATTPLSIGVVLLGAGCLVWGLRAPSDSFRRDLQDTQGSAGWITKLTALAPGPAMKILWSALCLGIMALGIAALLGA